jgi:hypothetical protein
MDRIGLMALPVAQPMVFTHFLRSSTLSCLASRPTSSLMSVAETEHVRKVNG